MKTIDCDYCQKTISGHYTFEVRCYHCGKYFYLPLSFEETKAKLISLATSYADLYLPQDIADYLQKHSLAESGPVIAKWYHDKEKEAAAKIAVFLQSNLTRERYKDMMTRYDGNSPLPLFLLDELHFPIKRTMPLRQNDASEPWDF